MDVVATPSRCRVEGIKARTRNPQNFRNPNATRWFTLNMNMKTHQLLQLGAALAVAVLPLSSIHAQAAEAPKPHKGMNAEERVAKMKTKLGLTDDQATQIKAIFAEQKAALEPIYKDQSLSKEQKREKAKPIMDAGKAKIDAVLTPEQKAKAEEARKKKKDKKD